MHCRRKKSNVTLHTPHAEAIQNPDGNYVFWIDCSCGWESADDFSSSSAVYKNWIDDHFVNLPGSDLVELS